MKRYKVKVNLNGSDLDIKKGSINLKIDAEDKTSAYKQAKEALESLGIGSPYTNHKGYIDVKKIKNLKDKEIEEYEPIEDEEDYEEDSPEEEFYASDLEDDDYEY